MAPSLIFFVKMVRGALGVGEDQKKGGGFCVMANQPSHSQETSRRR